MTTATVSQPMAHVSKPLAVSERAETMIKMIRTLSTADLDFLVTQLPEAAQVSLLRQHGFARTTFNKESANTFLADYRFKGQRKINAKQVRHYARQMINGGWVKDSVLQIAVLPDGTMILVNGYHRLDAVTVAEVSQEFIIIYHQCENMPRPYAQKARAGKDDGKTHDKEL